MIKSMRMRCVEHVVCMQKMKVRECLEDVVVDEVIRIKWTKKNIRCEDMTLIYLSQDRHQ
jgi:hypothetical protein